jgi:hypothetical protein
VYYGRMIKKKPKKKRKKRETAGADALKTRKKTK